MYSSYLTLDPPSLDQHDHAWEGQTKTQKQESSEFAEHDIMNKACEWQCPRMASGSPQNRKLLWWSSWPGVESSRLRKEGDY